MLPTLPIIPQYKMLLCYDIKRGINTIYYRYMMNEFVPALTEMEIYLLEAWHIAYGDYPVRQVEYVVADLQTIQQVFDTERWQKLEKRLITFTAGYTRKIIPYRHGFQF